MNLTYHPGAYALLACAFIVNASLPIASIRQAALIYADDVRLFLQALLIISSQLPLTGIRKVVLTGRLNLVCLSGSIRSPRAYSSFKEEIQSIHNILTNYFYSLYEAPQTILA